MDGSRAGDSPALVVIGGGTGLSTLLRGLKLHTDRLTAIVTVADDGGSSGRLRREMGILPPGDIRNCLVALARDESLLGRLFQYRFEEGNLSGHSFGNLFLAALTRVTEDFEEAVRLSSSILAITGSVLPATTDMVSLHAELDDGSTRKGQSSIACSNRSCRRVWLEPADVRATAAALEAIAAADAVVLGPGSLFTSIIPNVLISDIAAALRSFRGRRIFVCNVMTQPGETPGFTASDHIAALTAHCDGRLIDSVIVNSTPPPPQVASGYQAIGAGPVKSDPGKLQAMGMDVIEADIASAGDYFRHDSNRLASVIMAALQ